MFTLLSGEVDGFICLDECLRFVGSDQDFSDFFWLKPASFNFHLKIHHLFIRHNRNLEAQDICSAVCFSQLLSGHMFQNELGPHTFRFPAFLLKSCGWSKERKQTGYIYIYINLDWLQIDARNLKKVSYNLECLECFPQKCFFWEAHRKNNAGMNILNARVQWH